MSRSGGAMQATGATMDELRTSRWISIKAMEEESMVNANMSEMARPVQGSSLLLEGCTEQLLDYAEKRLELCHFPGFERVR
jgi:hypothetical protein